MGRNGSFCSAFNCNNCKKKNPDKSFFGFPLDIVRSEQWIINCRREDLLSKDPLYLHKNQSICSDHFESRYFLNDLKNRLQPNAVPTIFAAPNVPEQVTSKVGRVNRTDTPGLCSGGKSRRVNEIGTSAQQDLMTQDFNGDANSEALLTAVEKAIKTDICMPKSKPKPFNGDRNSKVLTSVVDKAVQTDIHMNRPDSNSTPRERALRKTIHRLRMKIKEMEKQKQCSCSCKNKCDNTEDVRHYY